MRTSAAVAPVAIILSLAASSASAMTLNANLLPNSENSLIVAADFVQGHEAIAGIPARQAVARAEASSAMAQRYFDADVIITLGALAMAAGAFVAVGVAGSRRRVATRPAASPREGWQTEVMQALEADLAQFTQGLRRAA